MADAETSDECAQFLKASGFHQHFSLPATPERDALNISYSDLGRQPTDEQSKPPPVLLFMPGMLASRFEAVLLHTVGIKMGVRILTIDRFGLGQSTNVPLAQRISTWVEVVPKLLAHLDIPHVAMASHSAGTLYLLNTLYSCRQILSPTRPYAVLLAPFVDIKHSGVKLLQAAQFVPDAALRHFDSIAKSLNTYVGPVIGSSLKLMDSWFSSDAEPEPAVAARHLRWQSEYGMSNVFLDSVLQAAVRAAMAEDTRGLNDETRLCLKKGVTWDECEDFDEFVKRLATRENQDAAGGKLRVKILFAQQDSMIGQRGRQYMTECWERNCRTEMGQAFDVIAKTVDDTDHDGVPGRLNVLEEILGDVLGEV